MPGHPGAVGADTGFPLNQGGTCGPSFLSAQKVVNNTGYSGTTRGSAPGVAQEVGNVTVFCALPSRFSGA
ncbi:hypothetical protein DC28_04645 [Spirochaeta lutea]|uniref:Uncharacterized protein n=1 Tax=Spirochaeta lutea TaxID=1480694 RepID=A0A098R0X4_9SPIO|nr:hypothetical protein DC28_04645 [Spirochaeta lutea]